jgi:hypothetical protein
LPGKKNNYKKILENKVEKTKYDSSPFISFICLEGEKTVMSEIRCWLSGLFAGAVICYPGVVSAEQYYVSPDGTGSDCTLESPCELQTALDNAAASTNIDDFVNLFEGTYLGRFTYTSAPGDDGDLIIDGGYQEDGSTTTEPFQTILDGGGLSGPVLKFNNYDEATPYNYGSGSIMLRGLTIKNGNAIFGGGLYGATNAPGYIAIRNVILEDNTAERGGGGCILLSGKQDGSEIGYIGLHNMVIRRNKVTGYMDGPDAKYGEGGGCHLYGTGVTTVSNTLIYGNQAGTSDNFEGLGGGLAMSLISGDVEILNSTISDNTAIKLGATGDGSGGGVYLETSGPDPVTAALRNTIVAQNTVSEDGVHEGEDISNNITIPGSSLDIDYSNYLMLGNQSGAVDPTIGAHTISADPNFNAGTYHLTRPSPCIDAGLSGYGPSEDLEGILRPQDEDKDGIAVVNMGCYETTYPLPSSWPAFLNAILTGRQQSN